MPGPAADAQDAVSVRRPREGGKRSHLGGSDFLTCGSGPAVPVSDQWARRPRGHGAAATSNGEAGASFQTDYAAPCTLFIN